jgi:sialic acid synthase SpsE
MPEYWDKVIGEAMAKELVDYGNTLGVDVFFSVYYPEAVDICERLGVKYYKIRYEDRFNYEIRDKVFATKVKTGNIFISGDNLFCVPKYPAEINEYPFYLRNEVGYSDHTHHNEGTTLLEHAIKQYYPYHEIHVKEDDNCLEWRWSKSIDWIKRCLNK